jgi:hypothetical protein
VREPRDGAVDLWDALQSEEAADLDRIEAAV